MWPRRRRLLANVRHAGRVHRIRAPSPPAANYGHRDNETVGGGGGGVPLNVRREPWRAKHTANGCQGYRRRPASTPGGGATQEKLLLHPPVRGKQTRVKIGTNRARSMYTDCVCMRGGGCCKDENDEKPRTNWTPTNECIRYENYPAQRTESPEMSCVRRHPCVRVVCDLSVKKLAVGVPIKTNLVTRRHRRRVF